MHKSMRFVFALMLLFAVGAPAQIPRTLSYQGILTDSLGNPKPDNSYIITFRLYDAGTGGNLLWTSQKELPVKRGLFSTTLGDAPPFGAAVQFDRPYWLSIDVLGGELSPRIPLSSVAYSLSSAKADTALVARVSVGDTTWKRNGATVYHSGGNVGIGTTSPSTALEVNGDIKVGYVNTYFTGAYPGLRWNSLSGSVAVGAPNPVSLELYAGASAPRVVINASTGNVGIGTTAPSEKLEMGNSGNILMKAGAAFPNDPGDLIFANLSGMQKGRVWSSPGLDRQLLLSSKDNAPDIAIDSNGNVGIGTQSPGKKLTINSASDYINSRFTSGAAGTFVSFLNSSVAADQVMVGAQGSDLRLISGGTDRIAIKTNGNVGVGTLSPDQLLSVNGGASKVGGGSWSTFSDRRLKQDIRPYTDGLDLVRQIRPVSFRYNGKLGYPTDKTYIGVIAQDIRPVAPYTVEGFKAKLNPGDSQETELLRFDPSALTYLAINAIRELDAKVAELNNLHMEHAKLLSRLADLERVVNSLASEQQKRESRSTGGSR